MADSRLNEAERAVQQSFSKSRLFSGLAVFALVLLFQSWLAGRRLPLDLSPRAAHVVYVPVRLDHGSGLPRIAGAWSVHVDDRRFGGISALAIDCGKLVALSDSGFVFTLDPPGGRGRAGVLALPMVPGNPRAKAGRDSEALASDPLGRGWWVAFEGGHSLLLYDPAFAKTLRRASLDRFHFSRNRGVEALLPVGPDRLAAMPESSGISDAALLPGGGAVMLRRWFSIGGFGAEIDLNGKRYRLPLANFDNAEGIAAAPLPGGGTRLWIVTDNDALPLRRTLLVAVDVAPTGGR